MNRRGNRLLGALLACCLAASLAVPARAYASPAELVSGLNADGWEVLLLTNKERMAKGLQPLSVFAPLQAAANVRAEESKTLFAHTRPDGTACFTALDEVGLRYARAAENIAYGYTSPAAVVDGWMNSPGHRANILDGGLVHMGMGALDNHWSQMFLTDGCTFDALTVLPGASGFSLPAGGSVEDLGAAVCLHCAVHGDCYLPLCEEMCRGVSTSITGTMTIPLSCCGAVGSFTLEITSAAPENGSPASFWDVSPYAYYSDAVNWAVKNNITNGTGGGQFSPAAPVTRAMAVTFLWRAAGCPEPHGAQNPFFDVAPGQWYAKAILWAVENNITNGMGDGWFGVDGSVTRGQMIAFLWRAKGRPNDIGGVWYAAPEAWARGKGLLSGTAALYSTDGVCPRADVVYYLYQEMAG